MAYYTDLFSPNTYEAFSASDRTISGFSMRQRNLVQRLQPGDKLLCYLTKVSRWVGVLTVESALFEDHTPLFYPQNDPFVVRVRVRPDVWLKRDTAVPIHEDAIWDRLSFTRGADKRSSQWTGKVRGSLVQLSDVDGAFLEALLQRQAHNGTVYPIDEEKWHKALGQRVRLAAREISVSVPEEEQEDEVAEPEPSAVRESIKMQALLARIGEAMGFKIWLPRADRGRVLTQWSPQQPDSLLNQLPINYDNVVVSTIEQIDVIWIRGRTMARMFEVEHTTSIYSGILRMADLCALLPEINVRLHIVAPAERRDKVFQEIRRPVFAYLDKGPLAEVCTLITYDSLEELARQPHLNRLRDDVLEDYEEEPS
jgi:hypothetical protein